MMNGYAQAKTSQYGVILSQPFFTDCKCGRQFVGSVTDQRIKQTLLVNFNNFSRIRLNGPPFGTVDQHCLAVFRQAPTGGEDQLSMVFRKQCCPVAARGASGGEEGWHEGALIADSNVQPRAPVDPCHFTKP